MTRRFSDAAEQMKKISQADTIRKWIQFTLKLYIRAVELSAVIRSTNRLSGNLSFRLNFLEKNELYNLQCKESLDISIWIRHIQSSVTRFYLADFIGKKN